MFAATRFNTVVTHDTHERLILAANNERPISRGERHRGAVTAIQQALADLNRDYLFPAMVDGYFGPITYGAVERFQRDYGLAADGIVGKQTMAQLDALYADEAIRKPCGMSVHIGVDKVDPAHYGSEMGLPSCKNDARAMLAIAEKQGYDASIFVNEEATTATFSSFMRCAAEKLHAGDALWITFSGHGGQTPNTSGDGEADQRDETMCFFDRMLIDDELYGMLGQIREGVRVHVCFDSCHSGTAVKDLPGASDDEKRIKEFYAKSVEERLSTTTHHSATAGDPRQDPDNSGVPIKASAIKSVLDGGRPEFAPQESSKEEDTKAVAALFSDLYTDSMYGSSKFLEGFNQVYENNKQLYDAVKNAVTTKENSDRLDCTVVALSACMDSQTTPAGSPLSLFTFNVVQTWNNGGFKGSYSEFQRALLGRSRPDATPQLNTYGASGGFARVRERPFAF